MLLLTTLDLYFEGSCPVRVLCTTFGSSGDVFPMFSLALELRQRGHDVTFGTNEHYAGLAASYGMPFEPLGTAEQFRDCVRNPNLWHPRRAFKHVFDCLCPVLQRHYDLHAEWAKDRQTLAITNCFGFGALAAQEKLGLRVLTLHCQPAVLWSDDEPPLLPGCAGPRWLQRLLYRVGVKFMINPRVRARLNPWRAELGLPPMSDVTRLWHSPFGILCMFPEWFAAPQRDWPRPLLQTDFPLWNRHAEGTLSSAVVEFLAQGEPPLVFSPGSMNLHGRPFFEAAVQACQTLGRRGILLTEFPDQLPTQLPDSVVHFDYVPLDLLLPRAAAMIHHGGIGCTSQTMLAGIPQVIMALAHDQFDNGQRARRLGVGDFVAAPRFTGPRLTRMLRPLLESTQVAANCRQLAARLAPRDGLRRSAEAIERHVEASS